jgi:uncharacterized protein YkwD
MPRLHHHLKNYFVPHDGNNHIPHALKPKRLIFHVGAAVVMKALVFAFIAIFPLSAWMTPNFAAQESKKIIAATNDLRVGLKLPALAENTKLDQAAADKVSDMLLNQYFAHVSPTGIDLISWIKKVGYDYIMAGENLAMGFNTAPEVMTAWEASPTHYANLTDPNFKDIGVSMGSGVYQGADTSFVAQYFGRPIQEMAAATVPSVKTIALPKNSTTLTVKSPVVGAESVLNVAVKLPPATTAATAVVNNVTIALTPLGTDNTWQGNTLVTKTDEKAMTDPVVPASVKVTDATGAVALATLDWNNVTPEKTSAYDQYMIFRQTPTAGMRSVLDISNIYFYILLVLITFALANLIIFRKKHHKQILATSLASLVVVVMLIVI